MTRESTGLAGAAIVIALVFALGTGVAGAAKSGNSANAKKCQGTGYLDWVDADGNAFASAGCLHRLRGEERQRAAAEAGADLAERLRRPRRTTTPPRTVIRRRHTIGFGGST